MPEHLLPCTRCNGSGSEPMTSPEPAAVPPQAITAAAEALAAGHHCTPLAHEREARAALEAAAPHLEAAAAERLAAWLEGPEAAAVTANAIRGQVDREIAEAAAAERERCAQLIEQQKELRSPSWFATLLREQP